MFYANVRKDLPRNGKLALVGRCESARGVKWTKLRPDSSHAWIPTTNGEEFSEFVSIATKEARQAKNGVRGVIFKDYSLGVATHRDSVVYGFEKRQLGDRMEAFVEAYNIEVDRWKRAPKGADVNTWVNYAIIRWDRDLKADVKRGRYATFSADQLREIVYRPFARKWLYFDRVLNSEVYGFPSIAPTQTAHRENTSIVCSDQAHRSTVFSAFAVYGVTDLHLCATLDGHQCLPRYMYDEDGTNRRDNITDWALALFRAHFASVSPASAAKARRISKNDLFHYVYAVLHHPKYRADFAENLKRELPRIPLAKSFDDFTAFVRAGEKLAHLHLNYDDEAKVKPFPLRENWTLVDADGRNRPRSTHVEDKMRLSKDKSSLRVNPVLAFEGIPEEVFRYRLGNRSALEWVIDQYQVYSDAKTGITSDPNKWGEERDDPEYIIRLVKQVITVSLETMKIIDALPPDYGGPPAVPVDGTTQAADDPGDPPSSKRSKGPKFELRADQPTRQRRLRP